jgi:hypothetical protein
MLDQKCKSDLDIQTLNKEKMGVYIGKWIQDGERKKQ